MVQAQTDGHSPFARHEQSTVKSMVWRCVVHTSTGTIITIICTISITIITIIVLFGRLGCAHCLKEKGNR